MHAIKRNGVWLREAVLHSLTISAEQLALLNPELSLEDLDDDVRDIMGPAH